MLPRFEALRNSLDLGGRGHRSLRNERELPPHDGVEGVHGLAEGVGVLFEGGQVLRLDRMSQFDETINNILYEDVRYGINFIVQI